ncbi:hypothetical protein QF021_001905 [Acidovorax delafieldii]|uniref:hypothetical protein n=1 Tax=Acidovorax delafieldii TaxID=47920 RepID=UPI00285F40C5|nr:hypothetical protein [Acidovorax delafieldii]MDR6153816.1 hypothetical protein [Acidovorax delafieldii]
MLVTHVVSDCPGCGAKSSFGNVSVRDNHVLLGCKKCRHESMRWLPEIRKKVLYLDQCFFSGAFRGGDPRFVEAVEQVKRLVHLQLLLVPYSSIHVDETHQWRGYKEFNHADLLEFIKDTAGGAELREDYNVEKTQLTKAWSAFLNGQPAQYVLEDDDAIEGQLDQWDDYYRIDIGGYHKDVELRRSLKTGAVDSLIHAFDEWQFATTTFDQDVAIEMKDAAEKRYLDSYLKMVSRIAEGDFSAVFDSPIVATVVEHMLHWLPEEQPFLDKLKRCATFFRSEHFNQVPMLWIEARMFATLKGMVKRGAYKNRDQARRRLNGVFEDIKHIALYAPYCDAFFMDQPMADLVRQPTIDLENRFAVRVFSLNNQDDFLEWLKELEHGMSNEHKVGLRTAYPNSPHLPPA